MSIFYSNNVNDLFDYTKSRKQITLDDINSQAYNINKSAAMKMSLDHMNKQFADKEKPESK